LTLTRAEKESWVIELYNKGKTIREIAQLIHMSFGDISSITRRYTGEDEEQNKIRVSKASQALKLFEQGNNPVQVAIKLDIETEEVDRLYKEYCKLKGLHKLSEIYDEFRDNIFPFIRLYEITKNEDMNPQEVVNAINIAKKLPFIKAEYNYIRSNSFELKRQQEKLKNDLYDLNKYKSASAAELESLQSHVDKLNYNKQQLSSLIERLKENSGEYVKVKTLAERKVLEICYWHCQHY
jgi:transcriptional regulator